MKILKIAFASFSIPLGFTSFLNTAIQDKKADNKKEEITYNEKQKEFTDTDSRKFDVLYNGSRLDNKSYLNIFINVLDNNHTLSNFLLENKEYAEMIDWNTSIRIDSENSQLRISIVYIDANLVFSNDSLSLLHDDLINILSEFNNIIKI